jgi:hypothetical protein
LTSFNPKYPRTFHLPWSEEVHSDDKVLKDVGNLLNKSLTITTKMDGSNVCLSSKTVSSRSGYTSGHASFDLLKQKYALIKHNIPEGMFIYGEWLYAVHSIKYEELEDYLMVFAIYENGIWYSFNEIVEWCKLLDLYHVPVIKNNILFKNEDEMKKQTIKMAKNVISKGHEGIVVRLSDSFSDFSKSTGKYVRKGHVQTDKHWSKNAIEVQRINRSLNGEKN